MSSQNTAFKWLADLNVPDQAASDRMADFLLQGLMEVAPGSDFSGARFYVVLKMMAMLVAVLRSHGPEQAMAADDWVRRLPEAIEAEVAIFAQAVRRDNALMEALRHGH